MQITQVSLTKEQKAELEYHLYFSSKSYLKRRSKIVLLKAEGLPSSVIAEQLSTSVPTVNRWVSRYLEGGFKCLQNKPGQGRKAIMDSSDKEAVLDAIEKDRLSVMKAKERWQQSTGKKASRNTFRSFLSALAQDLDV